MPSYMVIWWSRSLKSNLKFIFSVVLSMCLVCNGEPFQHKDTRVPSEPRYDLRKRTNSKEQQISMLLLIQKFEKLSVHEMNEENLSKKERERESDRERESRSKGT